MAGSLNNFYVSAYKTTDYRHYVSSEPKFKVCKFENLDHLGTSVLRSIKVVTSFDVTNGAHFLGPEHLEQLANTDPLAHQLLKGIRHSHRAGWSFSTDVDVKGVNLDYNFRGLHIFYKSRWSSFTNIKPTTDRRTGVRNLRYVFSRPDILSMSFKLMLDWGMSNLSRLIRYRDILDVVGLLEKNFRHVRDPITSFLLSDGDGATNPGRRTTFNVPVLFTALDTLVIMCFGWLNTRHKFMGFSYVRASRNGYAVVVLPGGYLLHLDESFKGNLAFVDGLVSFSESNGTRLEQLKHLGTTWYRIEPECSLTSEESSIVATLFQRGISWSDFDLFLATVFVQVPKILDLMRFLGYGMENVERLIELNFNSNSLGGIYPISSSTHHSDIVTSGFDDQVLLGINSVQTFMVSFDHVTWTMLTVKAVKTFLPSFQSIVGAIVTSGVKSVIMPGELKGISIDHVGNYNNRPVLAITKFSLVVPVQCSGHMYVETDGFEVSSFADTFHDQDTINILVNRGSYYEFGCTP